MLYGSRSFSCRSSALRSLTSNDEGSLMTSAEATGVSTEIPALTCSLPTSFGSPWCAVTLRIKQFMDYILPRCIQRLHHTVRGRKAVSHDECVVDEDFEVPVARFVPVDVPDWTPRDDDHTDVLVTIADDESTGNAALNELLRLLCHVLARHRDNLFSSNAAIT